MKTHLDNLLESFPGLLSGPIVDIGAGKGGFIIDVLQRGGQISGIEYNQENIRKAQEAALVLGFSPEIIHGAGEKLPFEDNHFGFANLCEVVEHVQDPRSVLSETYRVLKPGGSVYISVPNRFGLRDQHFHLYLVNWIPRKFSHRFISLFGKHKDYSGRSGLQRLEEMHYFTYRKITSLLRTIGFQVEDIREKKIKKMLPSIIQPFALSLYRLLRVFVLNAFHLRLTKPV